MKSKIDPETCTYYGFHEVWEDREYLDDIPFCTKKMSLMYDPLKEDKWFDHNIKCPCKTYYKEYQEENNGG